MSRRADAEATIAKAAEVLAHIGNGGRSNGASEPPARDPDDPGPMDEMIEYAAPAFDGDPPAAEPQRFFRFLDDVEIENLPPLEWLVDGLLPARVTAEVHGPPESGKTFFTVAMALSIATGLKFFGREVKRAPVIYVLAEGGPGLGVRVAAWKHHHERLERAGVQFLTQPVPLLDPRSVKTFIAAVAELLPTAAPGLIVFDTLARGMVGGDENAGRDMGLAVDAMTRISIATGATCLAVHHPTKGGEAERGHSSLRGGMDTMIELKKEDRRIIVSCSKMKDAEHFRPFALELVAVQESLVLTAENTSAVNAAAVSSKNREALISLQRTALSDGLSASAWLKVTGLKDRTFYVARKQLIALGYVAVSGRGRMARYHVTPEGEQVVTANCNLTAE